MLFIHLYHNIWYPSRWTTQDVVPVGTNYYTTKRRGLQGWQGGCGQGRVNFNVRCALPWTSEKSAPPFTRKGGAWGCDSPLRAETGYESRAGRQPRSRSPCSIAPNRPGKERVLHAASHAPGPAWGSIIHLYGTDLASPSSWRVCAKMPGCPGFHCPARAPESRAPARPGVQSGVRPSLPAGSGSGSGGTWWRCQSRWQ